MKKYMKIAAAIIAGLLVIFVAALLIFPGMMVKSIVNTAGPTVLGVDVRLEKASFRLFQGEAELNGLFIGNPEGFNMEHLCSIGTIRVALQLGSLMTDTVIIDEIYIDSPVFTYQKSILDSNLSAFLKNLEGDKKDDAEDKDEDGKKVVIKKILIKDPMVKLSIRGIPAGASIPMPNIELTDIGKDSEGTTIKEALKTVFSAVFSSVTNVVTGSVKLVGKGGAAAVEGLKTAGEGFLNITKGAADAIMGSEEDDANDDSL